MMPDAAIVAGGLALLVGVLVLLVLYRDWRTPSEDGRRRFRRSRRAALILAAAGFLLYSTCTRVYWVTAEGAETRVVLLGTDVQLSNGQTVTVTPFWRPFGPSWVLNDSRRKLRFEEVVYGNSERPPRSVNIRPFALAEIPGGVDYLFTSPPDSVRTRGGSARRGWLH